MSFQIAPDEICGHSTSSLEATVTLYRNLLILLTFTLSVSLTLSVVYPFLSPLEPLYAFLVAAIFFSFSIFALKLPERILLLCVVALFFFIAVVM